MNMVIIVKVDCEWFSQVRRFTFDVIQKSPLEAREALMRWRMVMVPVKMAELMITMKVPIILMKWDEIWQEEMIFHAVLRCAISQMHHLAISSPPPVSFVQYL